MVPSVIERIALENKKRHRLSVDERQKALKALDQFERGEIGAFTVLRVGKRTVVNRFLVAMVDKPRSDEHIQKNIV